MMVFSLAPLWRTRVALESPRENPSGEKVKILLGPASETPSRLGPGSDQIGSEKPRSRMVRAMESMARTITRPFVTAMSLARV